MFKFCIITILVSLVGCASHHNSNRETASRGQWGIFSAYAEKNLSWLKVEDGGLLIAQRLIADKEVCYKGPVKFIIKNYFKESPHFDKYEKSLGDYRISSARVTSNKAIKVYFDSKKFGDDGIMLSHCSHF